MKATIAAYAAALLATTLVACSTTTETSMDPVAGAADTSGQAREIAPGMLEGYLSKEEILDSKAFVLPSPPDGSAMQAMDAAWAEKMQTLKGSFRYELAIRDADLSFPAAASRFSCAMGIPVTEEDTPELYMLLWRTMTDTGLAPYSAKNAYQRERPFMVRDEAVCTPEDEELLRKDGSYPSGHTSIGWGWALILTELDPENAEAILARGRAFGESRNVCNAHWYNDVVAGRLTGAAAVAKLHSKAEFLAAMAAAREDIQRVRSEGLGPAVDCSEEAAALAMPLD